jgi:hypothetical protein
VTENELALALDLAGHEPAGDVDAVWLEWRESLGAPEPCIVGHARRRGELGRPVRPEHQDADAERVAPAERVEGDDPSSVEDHEAAKSVGGPIVAAGAPVRTDAVVDFEGATLDDDPHAEATRRFLMSQPDFTACPVAASIL